METLKRGDLFKTSWGYDQTNYDFIIVEKVSPSGKTAICRRAKRTIVGNETQHLALKPITEGYGKSFRMKVYLGSINGEVRLKGSYYYGHSESFNDKRFGYFSKVKEGEEYWETKSEFGH
jgi:hypothetical protein